VDFTLEYTFCLVLFIPEIQFVSRNYQTFDNVVAQLYSVLPSFVRIPHPYGETKDLIRITAQPLVDFRNQIVGKAFVISCGNV